MLDHLGETTGAARIRAALGDVLASRDRLTADLEPERPATTARFVDALLERIERG